MKHHEIDTIERSARTAVNLLKVLASEKRLLILCKLNDGEKSVTELQEFIGISQSALSQHLAYLRQKKIVKTRKAKTKVLYSLSDHSAQELMDVLCQIFKK
jgi:DNA-binding transcriptional ArsR family regulator